MFETCQTVTMKNKKEFLLSCSGFFTDKLITCNMVTTGLTVSTSDNDQVKAAGKDYVNLKPV